MNNRERNWYEAKHGEHPPACQCVECTKERLERIKAHPGLMYPLSDEILRGPHIPSQEEREGEKERKVLSKRRKKMTFTRPHNITYKILIGIAIVFAILAGLSAIAWLLPNTFSSLGDALVRLTGNPDIRMNFMRIGNDPIVYTLVFALFAIGIRWLANKF